jgi:hypothetical protein
VTGVGGASGTGAGGAIAAGGASGGAAAGSTGTGGAAGLDPGDTPPWRPLNITATPGPHIHGNLNAGIDTRAKPLGKLAVDIGVNSGGYQPWLGKRGYHSMGSPGDGCAAPNLGAGRDAVGDCRLNTGFANIAAHVKATLTTLQQQFPEEDWGYFLNQDGSVRWSDVAISGVSHGATTAAVAGRLGARLWRVLSDAGPRDNTCGNAGGMCSVPFDPAKPPYDPNCPDSKIASWIDAPSKTPIDRFYALVGTTDVECGDIMFNMFRAGYVGMPVQWDVPNPVLTGTNKFYSSTGGHLDFLGAADLVKPLNTDKVLNIVFAIPPENQNPAF